MAPKHKKPQHQWRPLRAPCSVSIARPRCVAPIPSPQGSRRRPVSLDHRRAGTVVGPLVYPLDPFDIDVSSANQGPSWGHLFGTDNIGRDVLAQVLVGGRISLAVGFAAMLFGLFLGTGIGVVSGYFRRWDGP